MNLNCPMTEDYHESEMSLAPPPQDIQELTEMFSSFNNPVEESAVNDAMTANRRENSHGILGKNKKRTNSATTQKLRHLKAKAINKRARKVQSFVHQSGKPMGRRSSSKHSKGSDSSQKRSLHNRKDLCMWHVRVPHKQKRSQFATNQIMDEEESDDCQSSNESMDQVKQEPVVVKTTAAQEARFQKVRNYLKKKYSAKTNIKHSYKHRKEVAEKRLRIEGRFVTKQQAFEILGLGQQDLLDNKNIQELLTQHSAKSKRLDSFIQNDKNGGQIVKVHNFQALIDNNYSHFSNLRLKKDGQDGEDSNQEDKQHSGEKPEHLNLHLDESNQVTRNHLFRNQYSDWSGPFVCK